jgi:hypothetical protein|tara:strand:- start:7406 stop:7702 length:297 start_codon:yes stop_codon:yes gene_type:complete
MEEQAEAPKALQEKPELYADLIPVWECFLALSPARPQGMDLGAIPISEIVTYWKEIGRVFEHTDLIEKTYLIQAMDAVFLHEMRAKAERERKSKKHGV